MDRAVRDLAHSVRLVASLADPDAWAREHIEAMMRSADRWWPRGGPPPAAPVDPRWHENAAAARKALIERNTGPIPTITDGASE